MARPLDGNDDRAIACDLGAVEIDPSGDDDADGVLNSLDNCPGHANADQADSDGDGIGDACERPDEPSGFDAAPPATPLLVATDGAGLAFEWEAIDTEVYDLLRGRLDELAPLLSLQRAACELTDTTVGTEGWPGDGLFFLVVARRAALLSSLGRDSAGREREIASLPCP